MRRHQVALCLMTALALGACDKTKDKTQIVVTVWSDIPVPGEMDAIRLRVAGKEQVVEYPFQLTATRESGKYSIPVQLGLVPAGAKDASITISARPLAGITPIDLGVPSPVIAQSS